MRAQLGRVNQTDLGSLCQPTFRAGFSLGFSQQRGRNRGNTLGVSEEPETIRGRGTKRHRRTQDALEGSFNCGAVRRYLLFVCASYLKFPVMHRLARASWLSNLPVSVPGLSSTS